MLISLDMSSRMQVVDMLLNKQNKPTLTFFNGFQKIILTHDKAFFNLIKRDTLPRDWKYFELDRKEMSNESPTIKPTKEYLERAFEHLNNRAFEECSTMLRKELEFLMKRKLKKDILPDAVRLDDKQHQELSDMINQVKTKLENGNQTHLKQFLNQTLEPHLLAKLNTNFQDDNTLQPAEKGKLRSFQVGMIRAFQERQRLTIDIVELLNEARRHVDFVLNAAAHDTTLPAYEGELRAAYVAIEKIKGYLETH